jgi:polyisoprenoid-binding protein YceI
MTALSETTELRTALPAGTWQLDPVHSTIGFAVKHNVVATFRGSFGDLSGSLGPEGLEGRAAVESIAIDEPNLKGHLLSPEFFDADRHPELSFRSRSIRVEGDRAEVNGEITIKGVTKPILLTGSVVGPIEDAYGNGGLRIGLELETTIDRRDFGLDWNAPLPGGDLMLGNDVTIRGEFELAKEA